METRAYRLKETDKERQPRQKMQQYHLLDYVGAINAECVIVAISA